MSRSLAVENIRLHLRSLLESEPIHAHTRRLELAYSLAACPAEELNTIYDAVLKSNFPTGVPATAQTGAAESLAEWIQETLDNGNGAIASALLAAMVLWPPEEAPLLQRLDHCPPWLLQDYVDYLLRPPKALQDLQHCSRYHAYLRRFVAWADHFTASQPSHPAAQLLARTFTLSHNFIQSYFLDGNLRDVFYGRARIIERFLTSAGCNLSHVFPPPSSGRRKIGLLIPNMVPRTETFYVLAVIEHLNLAGWDLTIFCHHVAGHPLESVFREHCSQIIALPSGLGDQVQLIRSHNLDLLLIGSNVTAVCNPTMLASAHRLARVQVSLMTSPVTTGFSQIDALLSSEWNEPESQAEAHYTERLLKIPGSLNCYAYRYDTAPATVEVNRQLLQLPDDAIVFFSGANYYKIQSELSSAWASILAAVPNSYLVLMPFNPNWSRQYDSDPLIHRIESQLRERGVDPTRLRVVSPLPERADVHRVIATADVYLDSYPFSGACSLLDPLTLGIPVVAWKGDTARSLHSYSMLRALSIEEFAASSKEQYMDMAISLGRSQALRQEFKNRLQRQLRQESPLFDTADYGKRVSIALTQLFDDYLAESMSHEQIGIESLEDEVVSLARQVQDSQRFRGLNDTNIVNQLIRPVLRAQVDRSTPPHVVDVGACYGQISLPFVAEGWSADLFEPDARTRANLLAMLAGSSAPVRVFENAVGAENSSAITFYNSATPGLSGFSKPVYGQLASTTVVPCVRLADFLPKHDVRRVDFLKVDAEGWDLDVLRGHDFQRFPPKLALVEYSTSCERQTLPKLHEAIRMMEELGYRAVVFAASDDSKFHQGIWDFDVRSIHCGAALAQLADGFGNIVFYPSGDKQFLLALLNLLEDCRQPGAVQTECPSFAVK